jgi:hypothetical protein
VFDGRYVKSKESTNLRIGKLRFSTFEAFLEGNLWAVIKWSMPLARLLSLDKFFWDLPTYFFYFLLSPHPAYLES